MAHVEFVGIPPEKISKYLLNPDHPEGGSKAKFFLARGFDRNRPHELAWQAVRHWPGDIRKVPGATKHVVIAPVECPDGSTPTILTVWQIADDDTTAYLVTARPGRFNKAHPLAARAGGAI